MKRKDNARSDLKVEKGTNNEIQSIRNNPGIYINHHYVTKILNSDKDPRLETLPDTTRKPSNIFPPAALSWQRGVLNRHNLDACTEIYAINIINEAYSSSSYRYTHLEHAAAKQPSHQSQRT